MPPQVGWRTKIDFTNLPGIVSKLFRSGADFFAPAVAERRPESFRYVFASDTKESAVAVLKDAWGLTHDQIYSDATQIDPSTVPDIDILVATPECKKMSKRRRGGSAALSAEGAIEASACLAVVCGFISVVSSDSYCHLMG